MLINQYKIADIHEVINNIIPFPIDVEPGEYLKTAPPFETLAGFYGARVEYYSDNSIEYWERAEESVLEVYDFFTRGKVFSGNVFVFPTPDRQWIHYLEAKHLKEYFLDYKKQFGKYPFLDFYPINCLFEAEKYVIVFLYGYLLIHINLKYIPHKEGKAYPLKLYGKVADRLQLELQRGRFKLILTEMNSLIEDALNAVDIAIDVIPGHLRKNFTSSTIVENISHEDAMRLKEILEVYGCNSIVALNE